MFGQGTHNLLHDVNYGVGFTPLTQLVARSSQRKGLLQILQTTLVAVLSLPNVIKSMFMLVECGVGGAYQECCSRV